MKSALKILAAAGVAALLVATPAVAGGDKEAGYAQGPLTGFRVIERDARIDFPGSITSFQAVGRDGLLLRSGGRLYYMRLQEDCARMVRQPWWSIHVRPDGPSGVDHFAHVSINGLSCGVASIDRVERERMAAR